MRTLATIPLLLAATAASAQAPPQPPLAQPGSQPTVRCAPVQPPQQQGQGKDEDSSKQTTGQSREPLSDRLAQGEGIVCPPSNVDPQMNKGAPEVGTTPVLPPPGSPGGDPTVRPK